MSIEKKDEKSLLQKIIDLIARIFFIKRKKNNKEEKIFNEENKSKDLQRIYQYVNQKKYILFRDILKKCAEKYEINFLDCNEIFNNKRFDKEWLFLSRFHVTDLGNKYIDEVLLENLSLK